MPPFTIGEKSQSTVARYNEECRILVRQFITQNTTDDDILDWDDATRMTLTCRWFLQQHHRWVASHVRLKANALVQRVDIMIGFGLIQEQSGKALMQALKEDRPKAAKEGERHPAWRPQEPQQKKVRAKHLRKLIRCLLLRKDSWSHWTAGYLQFGSRIPFRPGEIFTIKLNGRVVSGPAEKVTDDRGLFDTVEIIIGDRLPQKYVDQLSNWIDERRGWLEKFGSHEALLAAMREKIRRACVKMRIPNICPYALRHFAIACLKRSGWTREEIAVVANHLTNRTAGDHYGKARSGIKRSSRLLFVDRERVLAVRLKAREYRPHNPRTPTA